MGVQATGRRDWRVLPTLLAAFPIVWLTLFYLFVLRARWQLGYWPTPYHPDPKDLGFTLHYYVVLLASVAVCPVALTTAGLLIVGRGALTRIWPTTLLLLASVALFMVLVYSDPGNFLTWFAD